MEKQFFDWEECDELLFASMEFFTCTLKRQIGKWKEGTIIPIIVIEYQKGEMVFFDYNNQQTDKFDLELKIKA